MSRGVADAICGLAARMLPRAERVRYAEEWRADVAADPDHALGYATSVLSHAVTLRLTLMGWVHPERPLPCRLGHHRFVTVHDNPENRRFTSHRCQRCGYVKDDWRGTEQAVVESFAWGNVGGPR